MTKFTPTGRIHSVPAAQYIRQEHGARQLVETIKAAYRKLGCEVVGDTIDATTLDFGALELRVLARMTTSELTYVGAHYAHIVAYEDRLAERRRNALFNRGARR